MPCGSLLARASFSPLAVIAWHALIADSACAFVVAARTPAAAVCKERATLGKGVLSAKRSSTPATQTRKACPLELAHSLRPWLAVAAGPAPTPADAGRDTSAIAPAM